LRETVIPVIEEIENRLSWQPQPSFRFAKIADAIEDTATRDKSQDTDPITVEIRQQMEALLESTKSQRRITPTGTEIS
jgi:hypothetical protein